MKKNDYLLIGVVILFVIIFAYILYFLKSEGVKCVAEPYKYSAKRLSDDNDAPVICSCNILKAGGATFFFDKDSEFLNSNINKNNEESTQKINYSIIEESLK